MREPHTDQKEQNTSKLCLKQGHKVFREYPIKNNKGRQPEDLKGTVRVQGRVDTHSLRQVPGNHRSIFPHPTMRDIVRARKLYLIVARTNKKEAGIRGLPFGDTGFVFIATTRVTLDHGVLTFCFEYFCHRF